MIRYALCCDGGHAFDAWFRDSADFDEQARRRLVECPVCGASGVKKQIMAPAVSTARKREARKEASRLAEAAGKVRKYIKTNFDDVGDRFSDVARAIHEGVEPDRAIYGNATPEQADALREEGVQVAPLPTIFSPDYDRKLN